MLDKIRPICRAKSDHAMECNNDLGQNGAVLTIKLRARSWELGNWKQGFAGIVSQLSFVGQRTQPRSYLLIVMRL